MMLACLLAVAGARAQCLPPPAGLVGWWPGDGGATNYFGTNNGTFISGATITNAGFVSQCFRFDGVNNAISIPDSAILKPTNFTVECWVRFSSLDSSGTASAGQQYIIFKQNTRSSVFEGIYIAKERSGNNDFLTFGVSSANGESAGVDATSPVQVGVWYHIAAVRGPNYIQLYVNGVLQGQATVTFAQNYGTLPMYFGSSGQSYWDRRFAGLLDEVSMYNRPLSSNEIAAIYTAGAAGKCKAGSNLSITTQPQSQNVVVGSNATFTVAATGIAPISYQWQFNSNPIGGATGTALTLTSVQQANAGSYRVIVTNTSGALTSSVATLTVLVPPSITAQPQSQTNATGATAIFSATAAGTAPLSYRWQLGGVPLNNGGRISGATTDTLTITSLQASDAGNYVLVVTNVAGTTSSAAATLTVNGPPVITTQPVSRTVATGTNVSFNVAATGTQPLSYQWRKNGLDIPSQNGTTLSFVSAQTGDAADYTVVVANPVATVTSLVATLTVVDPPAITANPQSQTNAIGAIANFTASATGGGTLVYRWLLNGVPLNNGGRISGATTPSLTISNLQSGDAGSYALNVSNIVGNATSSGATLTVLTPPSINGQPVSVVVAVSNNTSLFVGAGGTGPLAFQWRHDGVQIPGATSSLLSLLNAQLSDAGGYDAIVTNVVGSITSAVATVTVLTPPSITSQPQNQTNAVGTTAVFSATVGGSPTLVYRWQQNGVTVTNGGRFSGATSATLTITGVQNGDAGNYVLTVTNTVGTATSGVATLTVNGPPVITVPPASQIVLVGSNVNFTVTASGTAPLSYQWRKFGTNLAGATGSALALLNVQTTNSGNYQVVVSNPIGSVTSAVAVLTVNVPVNCFGLPSGTIGWWSGDGNANDIFSSNHGTLAGGATAAGVGRVAQGFTFDGTNSYVSIPDSPSLRPTNFTLEAWVKFDNLNSAGNASAGQQYIIFKQNTRSSLFEGIYLGKERVSGGDTFTFAAYGSTGEGASINATTLVSTGVWYHVACVRGPTTMQIYVNGQMQGQTTVAFAQNYGTLPLYFGTSGQSFWDRKFKGVLDEVTLYNRPLTASEISGIFAAGAGGKCKAAAPPSILIQPTNKVYVAGGTTSFTVVAAGTEPLGYRWFRDGFPVVDDGRISGSSSATLTLTLMQPSDIGNYQVTVTNALGSAVSSVASLNTGAAPVNDNFASAVNISGSSGSVTGNNANGTRQSGEPDHAGNTGPSSVWYNWTAPSASPVTFDTVLSAFDTLLGVYTGNAVNSLTPIASNNNISTNNSRSRLTFTPVAGTVYRIAVDGANGANGNLTLRWVQASVPLPDLTIFSSAVNPHITTETFSSGSCAVVEGLVAAGTRKLIRFDTQTANQGGADLVFGNPANNPQFVFAACHAHYHFQNYMSYRLRAANGQIAAVGLKVGFCVLDVFRWDSGAPNNAKYDCNNQGIQKGWGDLYDSSLDGQWIDITGLPDGNYTMEMEANPLGYILESNYANNITLIPITIGNSSAPPANDAFANAQTLLGTSPSVAGTTTNATKEAGEPNHAGNAGGHSTWYNWTAPSTKAVTIDTIGSQFNTLLAVYTGNAVGSLTLVTNNDDIGGGVLQSRVTFNAVAGTLYRIAVDGFNGAQGNVILTANQTVANDAFSACIFTGGAQGSLSGSTVGATKEAGEPNHGGNAGGHSTWYCWTAPVNGTATFDTIGSTFNTLLGIYTGNSVGALTLVGGNDDIGGGTNQSSVTFNAVGLTMYHIAIDGSNGDSGNTMLNWKLATAAAAVYDPNMVAVTPTDSRALLSFNLLAEGMCQIGINGKPQTRYQVERSCDLQNWKPLAITVADFDGKAWFTDKAAKHLTGNGDSICGNGQILGVVVSPTEARFYRVVEMP